MARAVPKRRVTLAKREDVVQARPPSFKLHDLRDELLDIANDLAPMTATHQRIRGVAMKLDALARHEA